MAYAEKYYLNGTSPGGVGFHISLQKDGYGGSTSDLSLRFNGLRITYQEEDPIIGLSASLVIFNDKDNWYDLDDITSLEEKEFKIVIDASYNDEEVTLFDGFINSQTISQTYLNNSTINLTGSTYLSKLKNTTPVLVNTIEKRTLIDFIIDSINLTEKTDDIRINCTLDPSGGTLTSEKTCFNICGLDTEVFWKNNEDKEDGTSIIKNILVALGSTIYWWNGKWYIERYPDIWTTDGSKNWVEYDYDSSYGYGDTGTLININEASTNLPINSLGSNNLGFVGASQKRNTIPGLQYLEINSKQNSYLNLTIGDFFAAEWDSYDLGTVPSPPKRGWKYPIGNITEASLNCERLTEPYQQIFNPANLTCWGTGLWYNDWGWGENNDMTGYGINTAFKVTVSDSSAGPTTLNINFKWCNKSASGYSNWWGNPNGYVQWYRLYWYLRNPSGEYYILWDEDHERWYRTYSSTPQGGSQYIELTPDEVDQTTGVYKGSLSIPLTDVSGGTTGDQDFIFSANYSTYRFESAVVQSTNWQTENVYGDFEITVSAPAQPNRIIGELNNRVLNKKKIDLKIFDIESLNYKNGFFTDSDFTTRTTYWTDDDGVKFLPLNWWLMHDKYQLLNRNRKKITGNLHCVGFIKPNSMWYDTADPSIRKYITSAYSYDVGTDMYNITFNEYDNTETINFNEV